MVATKNVVVSKTSCFHTDPGFWVRVSRSSPPSPLQQIESNQRAHTIPHGRAVQRQQEK